MSQVIIFGIGQIAEIVHFYLTNDSEHEVIAFTVDKEYLSEKQFKGLPVVPFETIEKVYSPNEYKMIIPISYKNMNHIRADRYYKAKEKGYSLISYISSKATYYGTPVGENTLIFENNVIQPFTKIGNNTILWSGNHVGHHTEIGNHCFVASHVVISGGVKIGDGSFLGVNSTIRDNIKIGKKNLIGAGSVILEDTEDEEVYSVKSTFKINKKSTDIKHI